MLGAPEEAMQADINIDVTNRPRKVKVDKRSM